MLSRVVTQIGAWNSRFDKKKQVFFTESIVILLMALAQASEDARNLHRFKRNQINPQKKNSSRGVEHRSAGFGSESIAAHRVLKARGHYCILVLISMLLQPLLATARGRMWNPTFLGGTYHCCYVPLPAFPLPWLGNSASAEVSGAVTSVGDRGRMYIPSSMLSLVFPTLIGALRADFLSGCLWQVQPSSES